MNIGDTIETKRYGKIEITHVDGGLVHIHKLENDDEFWVPQDKVIPVSGRVPKAKPSVASTIGCRTGDIVKYLLSVTYIMRCRYENEEGAQMARDEYATASGGATIPDASLLPRNRKKPYSCPPREWQLTAPYDPQLIGMIEIVDSGNSVTPAAIKRGNRIEINFASVCMELVAAGLRASE